MKDETSYNSYCPACRKKKIHTKKELELYHPFAGHGYSGEHGQKQWTHPDLIPKELRK